MSIVAKKTPSFDLSALDLQLRRLKPRATRYMHRVTDNGLYLRVTPKGKKIWIFRHWIDGKEHWTTIAGYPAATLTEAIAAVQQKGAQAVTARAGEGDAPGEIQARAKAEKRAEKEADAARPTVEQVATRWLTLATGKKTGAWSDRTKAENRRVVEKDILPEIGSVKIEDLTKTQCQHAIDQVLARSAAQAMEVYKILRRLLAFAVERGFLEDNPMTKVGRPYTYVPKERVLSVAELKAFLQVLAASDAAPGLKDCLRFQLLTACRPVESREADTAEFNPAAKLWTIPATRYKTRRPHAVALSRQALVIVKSRMGGDGLIFGSMGEAAVHQALRRMRQRFAEAGITEAFTPHDLRRTARTLMSEIGIPQEVAEACLGHVQPAIVSTYNRHSFPKEKADAWQRLADRIDEIEGVVNRPVPRKRSSRKSGDVIAFTARRQSA